MLDNSPLNITRRNLPHWRVDGATYFVTFRLLAGELSPAERDAVFQHVRAGDARFYALAALVIMPDHVHVLLRPLAGFDLSRITKGMKGVSAKLVNDLRGRRGALWQDESFDRIIRSDHEFQEKLKYMLDNPAKRELIPDGWDWPWWHVSSNQ